MPTSGLLAKLIVFALGLVPANEAVRRPVDFKLQDFRGAWHQLDEVKDRKLVVLAFLGTECPLAALYAPRLAELARSYDQKGVAFFGIDSNEQDAAVEAGEVCQRLRSAVSLVERCGERAGRQAGR